MVAPAEDALKCEACHARYGRMMGLAGLYVPGTTPRSPAGIIGLIVLGAALAGIVTHAAIRTLTGGPRHG